MAVPLRICSSVAVRRQVGQIFRSAQRAFDPAIPPATLASRG